MITTLQKRVAELEAQMADPVSLLTESLKTADSATVKDFVEVMQQAIAAHLPAAPVSAKKSKKEKTVKEKAVKEEKEPKEKKEGPAKWNAFVKSVQRELAAAADVDHASFFEGVDEEDTEAMEQAEKKFKEAAKEAGADWQTALKEASIQKKMEEKGLSREDAEEEAAAEREKKAAKKDSASETASVASAASAAKAASAASAAKAAKAPKPKEKKAAKEKKTADPVAAAVKKAGVKEEYLAELATMSIFPRLVKDTLYYIDQDTNEAFAVEEGTGELGERLGLFDAESETVE